MYCQFCHISVTTWIVKLVIYRRTFSIWGFANKFRHVIASFSSISRIFRWAQSADANSCLLRTGDNIHYIICARFIVGGVWWLMFSDCVVMGFMQNGSYSHSIMALGDAEALVATSPRSRVQVERELFLANDEYGTRPPNKQLALKN